MRLFLRCSLRGSLCALYVVELSVPHNLFLPFHGLFKIIIGGKTGLLDESKFVLATSPRIEQVYCLLVKEIKDEDDFHYCGQCRAYRLIGCKPCCGSQ